MNTIFISADQFPGGSPSSNRMLGYVKGMKELDYKSYFLLFYKQKDIIFSQNGIVDIDGTTFDSSLCDYMKFGNDRYYKHIINCFTILHRLYKKLKYLRNEYEAIHMYGIQFPFWHVIALFAKSLGYLVFQEQTEYPWLFIPKKITRKIILFANKIMIRNHVDGIIVISKALKDYQKKMVKNKVNIAIINMFVDPARFNNTGNRSPYNSRHIALTGKLYDDQNGVDDLVVAFKMIAHKYPDIKLILIGPNSEPKKLDKIFSQITDDIKERVIFTGWLSRDEIPAYLNNATLLVLCRPDNKQAEGGFPTKLGEYLATGKPVIVTAVGDIPCFLKDGKNAFIAQPSNPESFAKKMDEALSDPNEAKRIGENGKKLTFNEFNYLVQTKKMVEFMNDCKKGLLR